MGPRWFREKVGQNYSATEIKTIFHLKIKIFGKAFEVNETTADENRFFLKLGNSRGLNLLGNAFERGIENKFGKCDFETPVEDGSLFEIEGFLGRAF